MDIRKTLGKAFVYSLPVIGYGIIWAATTADSEWWEFPVYTIMVAAFFVLVGTLINWSEIS